MPNQIIDLMVDRVDLVAEGANSAAFIKLFKSKGGKQQMTLQDILNELKPEHKEVIEKALNDAASQKDLNSKIAELEKSLKTAEEKGKNVPELENKIKMLEAELAKLKAKPNEPSTEEVIKGLDPAVQEVFKSMQAQKKAAEEMIKKMNQEKVHTSAVAKAKELNSLPVKEDELVTVLEKGIDPSLMSILEASAKALTNSEIFKSTGSSAGTSTDSASDAWSKIEAKAAAIAKSKNITKQKAIGEAVSENPDLYKAYLEGGAN